MSPVLTPGLSPRRPASLSLAGRRRERLLQMREQMDCNICRGEGQRLDHARQCGHALTAMTGGVFLLTSQSDVLSVSGHAVTSRPHAAASDCAGATKPHSMKATREVRDRIWWQRTLLDFPGSLVRCPYDSSLIRLDKSHGPNLVRIRPGTSFTFPYLQELPVAHCNNVFPFRRKPAECSGKDAHFNVRARLNTKPTSRGVIR